MPNWSFKYRCVELEKEVEQFSFFYNFIIFLFCFFFFKFYFITSFRIKAEFEKEFSLTSENANIASWYDPLECDVSSKELLTFKDLNFLILIRLLFKKMSSLQKVHEAEFEKKLMTIRKCYEKTSQLWNMKWETTKDVEGTHWADVDNISAKHAVLEFQFKFLPRLTLLLHCPSNIVVWSYREK